MRKMAVRTADADPFARVRRAGLELSGVAAELKYDGSPVLRLHGVILAGLASHACAEPGTLVVRYEPDERHWLLDEAPDVFYTTDYYRHLPVALARLVRLTDDGLRDLLRVSWRLTLEKTPKGRKAGGRPG